MKKNTLDLNLPVGDFPEQHKWLSMNDYIEFINFTSKHFPRKRITKKEWLDLHRGVPFSIK